MFPAGNRDQEYQRSVNVSTKLKNIAYVFKLIKGKFKKYIF